MKGWGRLPPQVLLKASRGVAGGIIHPLRIKSPAMLGAQTLVFIIVFYLTFSAVNYDRNWDEMHFFKYMLVYCLSLSLPKINRHRKGMPMY